MISIIKRIVFLVMAVAVSATGTLWYALYEPNNTSTAKAITTVTANDQEVKVELYGRQYHDRDGEPIFAVSELINKSINYKKANLDAEDVTIDFAIYRADIEASCYYDPSSRNYGKVTSLSVDYTEDCERVLYSLVKAAKYGITTRFIYHRDDANAVMPYMEKFMKDECYHDNSKTVADYLIVRRAEWPLYDLGINQMHNKQLLVSDYLEYDGTHQKYATWSATSNVDKHYASTNLPINTKDWCHTGFVITGHKQVYDANVLYFDETFENYKDRMQFVSSILDLHAQDALNYQDEYFECYFFPMPKTYVNGYDMDFNPYAKYIEKLNSTEGEIEFRMNMYNMGSGALSKICAERIYNAFKNNANKSLNYCGVKMDLGPEKDSYIYNLYKEIGDIADNKMTHAKDAMFYYAESQEYVVITGSTNLHLGSVSGKSDTLIVFKEKGDNHEIYDFYVQMYEGLHKDKYGIGLDF